MTAAVSTPQHAGPAKAAAPPLPAHPGSRPLRVVIRAAPPREPPFDDELTEPPATGPWDQLLPFAPPPGAACASRTVTPPRPPGLPDPGRWGYVLLVGLVEAAAGRRPLQQLATMMSPSLARALGADLERRVRGGAPHWLHAAGIRTVRAAEPAEGVAELCATLDVGPRVRALALRLEDHHGHWRLVRLQLG